MADEDEANWPVMQENFSSIDVYVVKAGQNVEKDIGPYAYPHDKEAVGKSWTIPARISHILTKFCQPHIPLSHERRLEYKHRNGKWKKLNKETETDDFWKTPSIAVHLVDNSLFQPSRFLHDAGLNDCRLVRDTTFHFRKPQEEALKKIYQNLRDAQKGTRFMVVMPTGTGKTTVIALSPFMVSADKTLIVCPDSIELTAQVANSVQSEFSYDTFLGKHLGRAAGRVPVVKRFTTGDDVQTTLQNAHIIVTSIGALVQTKAVTSSGKELLDKFRPKLIVFDEGHHSLADSWTAIEDQLQYDQDWKYLLLTATPERGDGETYGLEQQGKPRETFFYLYKREDGASDADGYIKRTIDKAIPVPASLLKSVDQLDMVRDDYMNEQYMCELLVPAAKKLIELRTSFDGAIPVKMLIHTRTNDAADIAAKTFNDLSEQNAWSLYAAAIHGRLNLAELNTNKSAFKFPTNRSDADALKNGTAKPPGGRVVDVGVQCMKLGEGYDNPWISVSVFLAPAKSISRLSQYHGRAIRTYNQKLYDHADLVNNNKHHKLREAFLFYPKLTKVEKVIDAYMTGIDQNLDNIFHPVPVPNHDDKEAEDSDQED